MDNYQHSIFMKLQLNKEDYEAIKNLELICYEQQKTYLKLELDFKMYHMKSSTKDKIMKEFLYYENEILVGYLGTSNFGGDKIEVSGMVHPKFRRRGIFKKLYLLAKEEWQKTSSEVLVLCDHTSIAGLAFINHIGAEYVSSEYKMSLNRKILPKAATNGIKLRLAAREDMPELYRQDSIYFGLLENEVKTENVTEEIDIPLEDDAKNYLAEIEGRIIGKIRITLSDTEGFIYGFGVLPEHRGKGYGREILSYALNIIREKHIENIFLEVATENKNALGLYESCGFEEISVMDYYVLS